MPRHPQRTVQHARMRTCAGLGCHAIPADMHAAEAQGSVRHAGASPVRRRSAKREAASAPTLGGSRLVVSACGKLRFSADASRFLGGTPTHGTGSLVKMCCRFAERPKFRHSTGLGSSAGWARARTASTCSMRCFSQIRIRRTSCTPSKMLSPRCPSSCAATRPANRPSRGGRGSGVPDVGAGPAKVSERCWGGIAHSGGLAGTPALVEVQSLSVHVRGPSTDDSKRRPVKFTANGAQ